MDFPFADSTSSLGSAAARSHTSDTELCRETGLFVRVGREQWLLDSVCLPDSSPSLHFQPCTSRRAQWDWVGGDTGYPSALRVKVSDVSCKLGASSSVGQRQRGGLKQRGMGFEREDCHGKVRESSQESRPCRGHMQGDAFVQGGLPVQLMLSGWAAGGRTTHAQLPGTQPLFGFRSAVISGPARCCCGCAALRHRISTQHCPAAPMELRGLDGNFLSEELKPHFTAPSQLVNKTP